mmetsp:Transcript_20417/g.48602  ORF Transcript_20417/g.48602 Transcript_20417/m.48602 type:complete len:212 (+) Transcript_20417:406-1041(+)
MLRTFISTPRLRRPLCPSAAFFIGVVLCNTPAPTVFLPTVLTLTIVKVIHTAPTRLDAAMLRTFITTPRLWRPLCSSAVFSTGMVLRNAPAPTVLLPAMVTLAVIKVIHTGPTRFDAAMLRASVMTTTFRWPLFFLTSPAATTTLNTYIFVVVLDPTPLTLAIVEVVHATTTRFHTAMFWTFVGAALLIRFLSSNTVFRENMPSIVSKICL